MTNINFNEPSRGNMASNDPAFMVKNDGTGAGVIGASKNGDGTRGETNSKDKNGIVGTNDSSVQGSGGNGVFGFSMNPFASGVFGSNDGGGKGVFGFSKNGEGIFGVSQSAKSGVFGSNDGGGPGVFGFSKDGIGVKGAGKVAGRFEGDVEVTGDVRLLGADCAEEFDSSSTDYVDPGTVMVLNNSGNLEQSQNAYDKKVAGIVSGAGSYKPAIVLDKKSEDKTNNKRVPIALMGKVFCKVDATSSPIEIGDLLTTSSLKGHAMKAEDPYKAFGAVIGKALSSIKEGIGMIPVLVALQ